MGIEIFEDLQEKGVSEKKALEWAKAIAGVFGKLKKASGKKKNEPGNLEDDEKRSGKLSELEIEQLAHFSPEERAAIEALSAKLADEDRSPTKENLDLLRDTHKAVDIAMFGRMLANSPAFNMEAAAQVAHAVSVHRVTVEDDYFTAVDDLNKGEEDLGAAHIGETEFGAGLFYLYLCIDRELLKENLSEDGELAQKAISALIEAAATVAPKGKQNSFASRAYASFVLCERGDDQPRSLSVAFLKPVTGFDMMSEAIKRIQECRENMNKVYGIDGTPTCAINAHSGEGSFQEVVAYAIEGMR